MRLGATRRPLGLGKPVGMQQPGPALSPHLFIVGPHAEVGRLKAHLAQHGRDLAAVVGGVVDRLHEQHHHRKLIGLVAVGAPHDLRRVHGPGDGDEPLPAAARVLA